MINNLILLSGIDIPFIGAQINIHQPRIKEISFIGEEAFFLGCEMLNFSKNLLSSEDKINLENKTNFDILMSIMNDKNPSIQKSKIGTLMLLNLIFPDYNIKINKDCIDIIKNDNEQEVHKINNNNFEQFKEIVSEMFCLKDTMDETISYNPGGIRAEEIAAKLKKGRAIAAKAKGEKNSSSSVISRRISILTVGSGKSFETLCNYTLYQLFDEFKRYELKYNFDIYIKAKMAGAQKLEEAENWMKDIHL